MASQTIKQLVYRCTNGCKHGMTRYMPVDEQPEYPDKCFCGDIMKMESSHVIEFINLPDSIPKIISRLPE